MITIFENLKNYKIPYIVCVAKSKLKNAYDSKESFGADYFIAVPFDTDNMLLEYLEFNLKTNQNHKQVIEYNLKDFEIDIFRQNLNNFKMVINDKYGIVYEPLHISLAEYFYKLKSKN